MYIQRDGFHNSLLLLLLYNQYVLKTNDELSLPFLTVSNYLFEQTDT